MCLSGGTCVYAQVELDRLIVSVHSWCHVAVHRILQGTVLTQPHSPAGLRAWRVMPKVLHPKPIEENEVDEDRTKNRDQVTVIVVRFYRV